MCISAVPRRVPTGYGLDDADTVSAGLVAGVVAAGAAPVILPVVPPTLANRQLAGAAGLILSGGQDLDLESDARAEERWIHPARDRHEFALWAAARERRLPVFGLCRGMQLVNVALGGTLVRDLPGHDAGAKSEIATHEVTSAHDSKLAGAVGASKTVVNSVHHQAIETLGQGLCATAWAPDRSIEAVETAGGPWFVGVQWHPELMLDAPAGQALFDAFAKACRMPSPEAHEAPGVT